MAFESGLMFVASAGVCGLMVKDDDFLSFIDICMRRFRACDWGDLPEEDAQENDKAMEDEDGRILASYPCDTTEGVRKVWIIKGRSSDVATILFPSEY